MAELLLPVVLNSRASGPSATLDARGVAGEGTISGDVVARTVRVAIKGINVARDVAVARGVAGECLKPLAVLSVFTAAKTAAACGWLDPFVVVRIEFLGMDD